MTTAIDTLAPRERLHLMYSALNSGRAVYVAERGYFYVAHDSKDGIGPYPTAGAALMGGYIDHEVRRILDGVPQ